MGEPLEDYALIGDRRTAALVSRHGSIDWLCLPRFDSPSVFGALLGEPDDGCWSLRPVDPAATPTRRYDGDTFVLVTRWETASGIAEVIDAMPIGSRSRIVRRIRGVSGEVEFRHDVRLRFDYARALPWVRQIGTDDEPALQATAGRDAVVLRGPRLHPDGRTHRANVTVRAGETADAVLTRFHSWGREPARIDVGAALERTRDAWTAWAAQIDHAGPRSDAVVRSLLVLRALSHRDTGGIVAAATTSLPELIGGSRNWDYRYVWLRDASLVLEAMLEHGFSRIAGRWRQWLVRAVAGDPADVQIMYGLGGERELPERELPGLAGYEGSAPVRIGNAAVDQFQADVIGEVLVALEAARDAGIAERPYSWAVQRALLSRVVATVDLPDHGLWEIRGEPRHFVHSRVMVWAALDRGVRAVREHGLEGDADRWVELRDRVRSEIETDGVDDATGGFVQAYGSSEVDAALLLLPQVGFCEHDDPRMLATVAAIERTLLRDGLVRRYRPESGVDGIDEAEHPFLACSFWLVEQYAATGRADEASELFDRLCGLRNDVGLLSEEYDPGTGRLLGNLPQAFSHLALVRAADALGGRTGRGAHRRG
ncbi:glycoside hydrolase family 15 protein [Agromyces sp. MMS17-SY077]|uniref:Glycoside hydrolase family 15 protein n=2 Tax=Agromyces seonyuensis TaxID=2662446 RepID=A0A6I4P1A4_9MICO|nr:glycoside hydrolase family 15 protein [Agromyces seonyuensis]